MNMEKGIWKMNMENLLSFEEKPNQHGFCMHIFSEIIITGLCGLPETSMKQVHPVDKVVSFGEKEQCF